MGHFVSSLREREKRDSRGDEKERQERKKNRNESEETEEINLQFTKKLLFMCSAFLYLLKCHK